MKQNANTLTILDVKASHPGEAYLKVFRWCASITDSYVKSRSRLCLFPQPLITLSLRARQTGTHEPCGTQKSKRNKEQKAAQLAIVASHTARVVHGMWSLNGVLLWNSGHNA